MSPGDTPPKVAYFSMEIALDPALPTYSGGLGILAGDMLRSAADLELPMVGVTLVHRKGYFRQHLDASGWQTEEPDRWDPQRVLRTVPGSCVLNLEGRQVTLRAWRFDVRGIGEHIVPVYLLDADQPENSAWDRTLTDELYGGDNHYRLCQEAILGIGGREILGSLGLESIETYHMNEGHSALLGLHLLEEQLSNRKASRPSEDDIQAVRRQCVFTTHTPVPAGHDKFDWGLVQQVLGPERASLLEATDCCQEGVLNMTYLALRFSHYVNGVAMHHGEVSRDMFPRYPIHAITNGVHAVTWAAPAFQKLYDRHLPEWRADNLYLRYAVGISLAEITEAHAQTKNELLAELKQRSNASLDPKVFTIGFARRAATYKRADLLFSNLERLRSIPQRWPLQLVYGGKAHPHDQQGKAVIQHVFAAAAQLRDLIRFVYVENYGMNWAKLICSGVDLWLNTPQRPQEASGTSGMKAALNGVPSLSILDGWWDEGHFEGVTGWAIGHDTDPENIDPAAEAAALYQSLEEKVLPTFYSQPEQYAFVRRSAIALNGSFFNTQRMAEQYASNAYASFRVATETPVITAVI